MTKGETSSRIQKAIELLTAAKAAVDAETGHYQVFRSGTTEGVEIVSPRGTVTVLANGEVLTDPTEVLTQKSVTDSVFLNERYAMIAAPKGQTCPTCDGRGTI